MTFVFQLHFSLSCGVDVLNGSLLFSHLWWTVQDILLLEYLSPHTPPSLSASLDIKLVYGAYTTEFYNQSLMHWPTILALSYLGSSISHMALHDWLKLKARSSQCGKVWIFLLNGFLLWAILLSSRKLNTHLFQEPYLVMYWNCSFQNVPFFCFLFTYLLRYIFWFSYSHILVYDV